MSSNEIDRKIAVIFVADVVGYSKHMEKEEDATLKSYSTCERLLHKLLEIYKVKIPEGEVIFDGTRAGDKTGKDLLGKLRIYFFSIPINYIFFQH